MPKLLYPLVAVIALLFVCIYPTNCFTGLQSVKTRRLHPSSLGLFPKRKPSGGVKVQVPTQQLEAAYKCWKDSNKKMKPTAPNYLSKELCDRKFAALVNAVGSADDALAMVKADPMVLAFREQRVAESYAAWCEKLGGADKALPLCIRNPPILSLSARAVEQATGADVAQTIFWSYVAVIFRPITVALSGALANIL